MPPATSTPITWLTPKFGLTLLVLSALAGLVYATEPLGQVTAWLARGAGTPDVGLDLLMVPFGAALIVAMRSLIGIEGFGLFSPLILAYSFGRVGTVRGLLTFVGLLLVITPIRMLLDRVLLLSVARTGILVGACAIGLFLLTALAVHAGLVQNPRELGLPVVIMAGIVDRFVTAQMDQSTGEATKLSAFTVLSAGLVAALFGWSALRDAVSAHPDLALLAFPICLFAGRYTGLRLTEYVRFRAVAMPGDPRS